MSKNGPLCSSGKIVSIVTALITSFTHFAACVFFLIQRLIYQIKFTKLWMQHYLGGVEHQTYKNNRVQKKQIKAEKWKWDIKQAYENKSQIWKKRDKTSWMQNIQTKSTSKVIDKRINPCIWLLRARSPSLVLSFCLIRPKPWMLKRLLLSESHAVVSCQ